MQKNMHTSNGRRGPCVHVRSGRVDGPKDCIFNYECHHCAFDQWLDHLEEYRGGSLHTDAPAVWTARPVQTV